MSIPTFDYLYIQKNMVGQAGLGLFYLKGRGVQQDYAKAVKYVKLSAEQGWPEGLLYLGSMYFDGEGFERCVQIVVFNFFLFRTKSLNNFYLTDKFFGIYKCLHY